jgi:hypothetical protein
MSLEGILITSPLEFPRSDIYVNKLMYNDLISDFRLNQLISNNNSSGVMSSNAAILQQVISEGGNITLPKGIFYINSQIVISTPYTIISGQNIGETIIKLGNASNSNIFVMSGTSTVKLYGCQIKNLTLDGSADGNNTGSLVRMQACQNCSVTNCELYNATTAAVFSSVVSSNGNFACEISNNIMSFSVGNACRLFAFDLGKVENNFITFANTDGVYVENSLNVDITNNYIYRCNNIGVQFINSDQSEISDNNIIRTNNEGVLVDSASINAVVENNYVRFTNQSNTGKYSINISGEKALINSNYLFEDSVNANDQITGPNNIIYPAKTVDNDFGIQMTTTALNSIVINNYIDLNIANRINNLSLCNVIDYQSQRNIFYKPLSLQAFNSLNNYTASDLNAYMASDFTISSAAASGWAVIPGNITVKAALIGRIVTLSFPGVLSTTSGGDIQYAAPGLYVPNPYTPTNDIYFSIITASNGQTYSGSLIINSSGQLTFRLSAKVGDPNYTNGTTQSGWLAFSVSYCI